MLMTHIHGHGSSHMRQKENMQQLPSKGCLFLYKFFQPQVWRVLRCLFRPSICESFIVHSFNYYLMKIDSTDDALWTFLYRDLKSLWEPQGGTHIPVLECFHKEMMRKLRCDGEHDLACGGWGINSWATCVFNLEDRKSMAYLGKL